MAVLLLPLKNHLLSVLLLIHSVFLLKRKMWNVDILYHMYLCIRGKKKKKKVPIPQQRLKPHTYCPFLEQKGC